MSSPPPSDDDERTVLRPTVAVDSQMGGFVSSSSFLGHTLPEGTIIGGLEITGLIGEGGFGIVYLANDSGLQRQVAVKEYMPSSLAARASGSMDVQVKSERHADTFKAGLKSFVNEARLLAKFDHDSLVKVYRFWEANGTAYMAMPYYEGPTLKRALAEMKQPPDEAQLRAWLHPILDALAVMHHAHCFHRDIAPDNILLTASGPLLLDFGAARRVIGDMTHALTVVLKPGYAPIEQYGDSPNMAQGAWTDLYALACVVYYAITGKAPMSSVERLMGDRLQPLSRIAAGRYSEGFLHSIDAALGVRPQERPQDVAQFRALLDAGLAPSAPAAAPKGPALPSGLAAPPREPGQKTAQLHAEERTHPTPPPAVPRPAPPPPAPAPAPPAPRPPPPPPPPPQPPPPAPRPPPPPPPAASRPPPASAAPPPRIERTAWAAEPAVLYREPVAPPAKPPAAPVAPPKPAPAPPASGEPRNLTPYAMAGVAALLALALAAAWVITRPPDLPKLEPAEPAASVPAAPASAAALDRPVPPIIEPVASAAAIAVPPEVPASAPAVAAPAASPVTAATPPVIEAPRPRPRPPPEVRKPPRPQVVEAPPTKPQDRPARCSDILQKASLETLNAEEAAFLRRECR